MKSKTSALSPKKLAALAVLISAVSAAPAALTQTNAASPCAPKRKKAQEQSANPGAPCAPRKKRTQSQDENQTSSQSAPTPSGQSAPGK